MAGLEHQESQFHTCSAGHGANDGTRSGFVASSTCVDISLLHDSHMAIVLCSKEYRFPKPTAIHTYVSNEMKLYQYM